jgi:hypothetical protein
MHGLIDGLAEAAFHLNASAAVVGIVVVVRCRRRTDASG